MKKKQFGNIFYLTCDHFKGMTQPILTLKVGFHWQMTHVEFANDVVHFHNIER